jgi:hypothetical protein
LTWVNARPKEEAAYLPLLLAGLMLGASFLFGTASSSPAEGFAYEDGGQMLSTTSFAAFPADFFGWRGSRSVCRQAGIS